MVRKQTITLKMVLVLAITCPLLAQAGLKVYYVRHGETPSNARRSWEKVPKEEWPDYMTEKGRYLTPTGEQQAEALVDKLKPYTFDFIAVSPTDRTRLTILPYLKANGLTGEIWTDLAEMGIDANRKDQPPRDNLFDGKEAKLKPGQEPFFTFRADAIKQVTRHEGKLSPSEADAITDRVLQRVLEDFGGQDKTILLVGHGTAGRYLVRAFLDGSSQEKITGIQNTKIWMVEQRADGKFDLEMFNDEAVSAE